MSSASYVPQLQINGAPVEITSFELSAPEGRIGLALSFNLADQNADVERGHSCQFAILENGNPVNIIQDGFVVGRTKRIASGDSTPRPNDTFDATAGDALGERRFSLSPRIPIIVYDPAVITLSENESDTHVNNEIGERIYAEVRPIADLDFLQLLSIAYVEGAGFSSVLTNIENFPVQRQDFLIGSSFHKSVSSLYAPYKPQIYEDSGTLFIINPRGSLPPGFDEIGAQIRLANYISMTRSKPDRIAVNALLLTTHQTSVQAIDGEPAGGITYREETDSQTTGSTLDGDYQQSVTTRFIAEIHDDSSNPSRITSEVTYKTVTNTTGQDEDGVLRTLSTDTLNELFDYNFARKVGYNRTVDAYVKRPGELANFENVVTEASAISWESTGTLGEFRKKWESTRSEGLIMVQGEEPDLIKSPLIDANRFGALPEDATVERGAIKTRIDYFRETGADQVEITTQATDHMVGRPIISRPQHHTGTIRIQLRGTGTTSGTIQTLLRDEESETTDGAREPISFDGGQLPFAQALPLAEQALIDAKEPPETLTVVLLKPDFSLRRGQRRQVAVNRNDNLKLGFVTGYRLTGQALARGMVQLTQEVNLVIIN